MHPIKRITRLGRACCYVLALLALLVAAPVIYAQCPALSGQVMEQAQLWSGKPLVGQTYKVSRWYVQDGDSLNLGGGQRLRLGQINTTEMASKKRPQQAYAQQAKDQLNQTLGQHKVIYVQLMPKIKDHYGRWLVQLYDGAGNNAEEVLVAQGLAYVISMNEQGARRCLWQQEAMAQKQHLGLWQAPISDTISDPFSDPLNISAVHDAATLSPATGGFIRMGGTVMDISASRRHWYIGLKGEVAVKISKKVLAASEANINTAKQLEHWVGQRIVSRGWLTWRKLSKKQRKKGFKAGLMTLYHLDMLEQAAVLQ